MTPEQTNRLNAILAASKSILADPFETATAIEKAMAKTTIATIEHCILLWQIGVWLDFMEVILGAWKEVEL